MTSNIARLNWPSYSPPIYFRQNSRLGYITISNVIALFIISSFASVISDSSSKFVFVLSQNSSQWPFSLTQTHVLSIIAVFYPTRCKHLFPILYSLQNLRNGYSQQKGFNEAEFCDGGPTFRRWKSGSRSICFTNLFEYGPNSPIGGSDDQIF